MKPKLITMFLAGLFALAPVVRAADDEDVKPNAKLENYSRNVKTGGGGGETWSWLLLLFLAGITSAVLFMNSRRTHLD